MKKKIIIIMSCFYMLLLSFPASAMDSSTNEKVNEIISAQVSENEISEINVILLEQEGIAVSESNAKGSTSMLKSHDTNNIYKVYSLPVLMLTAYKENPTIDSLLTDDCVWEICANSILSENSIVRISTKNGEKFFSGIAERTDSYVTNEKIVSAIEQGGLLVSAINEIKIAKSEIYHSYFVFVTTVETDYVIPFPAREDFLGVETGKLYTLDDMIKTMDGIFDEAALEKNQDSYGGVPLRDPSINDNTDIVFVAVALSLIVLVLVVVLMKKKFLKVSKVQ